MGHNHHHHHMKKKNMLMMKEKEISKKSTKGYYYVLERNPNFNSTLKLQFLKVRIPSSQSQSQSSSLQQQSLHTSIQVEEAVDLMNKVLQDPLLIGWSKKAKRSRRHHDHHPSLMGSVSQLIQHSEDEEDGEDHQVVKKRKKMMNYEMFDDEELEIASFMCNMRDKIVQETNPTVLKAPTVPNSGPFHSIGSRKELNFDLNGMPPLEEGEAFPDFACTTCFTSTLQPIQAAS